jgi:DNA-binding XRE family transcriptional regulator
MSIDWPKVPGFEVWNRAKVLRKMRGLTQLEVAAGAGISVFTLWSIEAGFDERTSCEVKEKLARFFECAVEEIFPVEMVGSLSKREYEEKFLGLKTKANNVR